MTIIISILLIIALFYLLQILFLYRGLKKLPKAGAASNHSFSVVIAARNEESRIRQCLETVLNQSIEKNRFEVIVVDDRSIDKTSDIVSELASQYHNLQLIKIKNTPAGIGSKKYAVMQGVCAAKNEIIVCTDADCFVKPTWLDTIDRTFTKETGLVQGITTYFKDPALHPHFFGLQAVDFLSHGIVAASGIGAGLPINSNANNFAFRKQAFEQVGGYGHLAGVVSGDDDLLVQRIWNSKVWKVKFMADPLGAVVTAPTTTPKGVYEQRKRWGSKTVHYSPSQVAFLSMIFLFYLGIVVSIAVSVVKPGFFWVGCAMLGCKVMGESMLMIPGTRIFKQTELRKYIIPASLLQLPMVLLAVLFGVFGRFTWKEQKLKRKI